jgi:hypothetical protein
VLRTRGEFCGAPERQDGEGDEVQAYEGFGQAFVVAGEAAP